MINARNLAQLDIGRLRYPTDDPRMADFMNNLDLVNGLAERSKGFVWRLRDESSNATNFRPYDDPQMAVNLSAWESVKALDRYVYLTMHKLFYGRRDEWFDKLDSPHLVLWWIPAGHIPTVNEANDSLEYLTAHAPSPYAFSWKSVPAAQLWKTAGCAPDGRAV